MPGLRDDLNKKPGRVIIYPIFRRETQLYLQFQDLYRSKKSTCEGISQVLRDCFLLIRSGSYDRRRPRAKKPLINSSMSAPKKTEEPLVSVQNQSMVTPSQATPHTPLRVAKS